ncbi:hypothetical protein BC628DRAFT_1370774, partial [Trametes gibbosa]
MALEASASLETYATKPDCFRRSAGLIRTGCAELEAHEDARVRAALSMTLCEIATAENLSPPMECIPFQVDYDGQLWPKAADSPGKCVEALSRSAQYWSSYSGYLREVPQLCFAFRRWNDIDVAKELHRNSTLQSLALLQHLVDRERLFERGLNDSVAFSEQIQKVFAELQMSSAALSVASNSISEQLRVSIEEMSRAFLDSILQTRHDAASARFDDLAKIEFRLENALHDVGVRSTGPARHGLIACQALCGDLLVYSRSPRNTFPQYGSCVYVHGVEDARCQWAVGKLKPLIPYPQVLYFCRDELNASCSNMRMTLTCYNKWVRLAV